ncbi:YneF family protein [Mycoplasma tauri]|uniref:YneF family protein n=1 Tax=Mycoplasma tauri TaxID=547987 RepID=UPI001CBAFC45|nr:YneF family protein [Mycoplasma tauri]MBZ4218068.1 YneF family protein [Mycoplasma tauri]
MSTGGWIGIIIGLSIFMAIVGGFIGFIIVKKTFEKQIRENPPITRNMIKAMFAQMGRKASESQINAVMRSMTNAKNAEK